MATDIKLDDSWVVVEAHATQLLGHDLMLDGKDRRKETANPHRRALVHDFDDGLTVNWNADYPAGVTLKGTRTIEGLKNKDWVNVDSRVVKVVGTDVMLDSPGRRRETTNPHRRALVHDFNDGLTINWSSDYPGGVTINGAVKLPGTLTVAGKEIGSLLSTLTSQIAALEARVATLESKVR